MDKEERKVYTLRIPKNLHFQIEKSAYETNKSINSWFIDAAKSYLDKQKK